jgi:predicted permease
MTERPTPARHLHPEILARDLRHAVRTLARGRGFTLTVLVTLTLCMGAAVAAFSVFRSVVLEPLPFPGSERLVILNNSYPGAGVERASNGVPDYYDRKKEVPAFASVALYRTQGPTLLHGGTPERVRTLLATPSIFQVLDVSVIRGRAFTSEDGEVGKDKKVILTYGMWQRLFGGRDDALGKDLRLDGEPYTVIGVLPQGFEVPDTRAELVTPAAFTAEQRSDDQRHSNSWQMIARLTPGASLGQARAQIDALNARNLERFPQFKKLLIDAGFHTIVEPWRDDLIRDIRPKLALLLGGALFVLLIGCVNIANLILVRTSTRQKELATRCALGAGRGRLARQLITENVLLTITGSALGLLAGYWSLQLLATLGTEHIPRGAEIGLDGGVLLVTLAVALVLGAVFGLIPVVQVFRNDLSSIFREEGRTGSASRRTVWARSVLVAAQVAFAFILLVGAGFLLASFRKLVTVDPGFQPDGVLTATVSLPDTRYKEDEDRRAFADRFLAGVRTLPGVENAGLTDAIPFGSNSSSSAITVEGYEPQAGESIRAPYRRYVSSGYFQTLGIKLLEGRDFDDRDTADSQKVVIVDRWMAERYWPGRDPIGGRIFQGVPELEKDPSKIQWLTVVGVVDEILSSDLSGESNHGAYYYPVSQEPRSYLTVALETAGDPKALASGVRRVLGGIDPELPLDDVMTMDERIDRSLVGTKLPMLLATVFAVVALFLAAVGIYGVLAYAVAQRTRELGIRVALGSSTGEVFRLVLGQGVRVLALGLGIGLVGAVFMTRAMKGMLYGVEPLDPAVFLAVAGMLTLVVLAATAIPARRATQVDPVVALTAE